jgi:hypothetical protein
MNDRTVASAIGGDMADVAKWVAESVVRIESFDRYCLVAIPAFYRTGDSAVIRIESDDGRFRVSDGAMGHREADRVGAAKQYERIAKATPPDRDPQFDGMEWFSIVTREALPSAAIAVAHASIDATNRAIDGFELRRSGEYAVYLEEKLISAFGREHMVRRPKVRGGSGDSYTPDFGVSINDRTCYFDRIKPSRESVANAVTMFTDLAALDHPPICVSAVEDAMVFGGRLRLLSAWSHVIDKSTPHASLVAAASSGGSRMHS